MSVSTGVNTLPPEAISAETFASLRSMSPMDKSAIYTIHFPYSRDPMPELAYDWEMPELTIDEEDWQKWLADEDDDSEDAIPE